MASDSDDLKAPSHAKVFEIAVDHAKLIRAIYGHPEYHMISTSATFVKPDVNRTPEALFMFADFVENTYVKYVLPLLPPGATRMCKDVANPWAYADPNYEWEWTWDAQAEELKDKSGNTVDPWPKLSDKVAGEKLKDIYDRGFMIGKIALENSTDPKLTLLIGGCPFDYGEEVREAARKLE